jgi:uncharacterized protein (UPF0335 family)
MLGSKEQLKQYIARIERLEEDKSAVLTDLKEVYSEAKSDGFDTKAMKQIIKLRKADKAKLEEQEQLIELYKEALDMV